MQLLDHGVEPAGDGIVLVAYVLAAIIVLVSAATFWLWRRRDQDRK